MRRSDKQWKEFDELTTPFLTSDSEENTLSVAHELRDRMVKVEQQVLAQYTATAAYATIAQQGVDQARAEARSDLDRAQTTLISLLDRLRGELGARIDGLTAALDQAREENDQLRHRIDEMERDQLLGEPIHQDPVLVRNAVASEFHLG